MALLIVFILAHVYPTASGQCGLIQKCRGGNLQNVILGPLLWPWKSCALLTSSESCGD